MNYNMLDEGAILEGVKRFGPAPGARTMMDNEMLHSKESIESGIYITYWFEKKKSECSRLGSQSKCFCGHLLSNHNDKYFGKKFDTSCRGCSCKTYQFVPTRPEECGMYWLPRRKDFNVHKWRAPCKCNHNCEEHSPNYPLRCMVCMDCPCFRAYFACISCDGAWEVLFETEMERNQLGKPIGDDYKPLAQFKAIQYEVFENKARSVDPALWRPRIKQGDAARFPSMPFYQVMPAQNIIGPDGRSHFQPPTTKISFGLPTNNSDFPIQKRPQQQSKMKLNSNYDNDLTGSAQQKPSMLIQQANTISNNSPIKQKSQKISNNIANQKSQLIKQTTAKSPSLSGQNSLAKKISVAGSKIGGTTHFIKK